MKLTFSKSRLASGCMALAVATGLASAAPAQEGKRHHMPLSHENIFLGEIENTNYAEVRTEPGVNGEVEIVRERYPDGKVRIERQVTLNGDGNYVNHGGWKQYSKSGDVVAEGQYNFGQRVGMWTRWVGRGDSQISNEQPFKQFKPPFMSQATFVDGKMDGDWIITDANDRKIMIVPLRAGERNGTVTTWLPTGKVFSQITYNQSVPVGEMIEINPKTGEAGKAATFEDGRKVITKTENYYPKKQKKSEIMYLAPKTVLETYDDFGSMKLAKYVAEGDNMRHGTYKTWFSNGQLHEDGYYTNDKRSGTFTYWHENGQMAATGEYRDDQQEGLWVWWYANGQKSAVGKYEQGKLVGDWRWWDEQGKLTKQQTYHGTESAATESEERFDVSKRTLHVPRLK